MHIRCRLFSSLLFGSKKKLPVFTRFFLRKLKVNVNLNTHYFNAKKVCEKSRNLSIVTTPIATNCNHLETAIRADIFVVTKKSYTFCRKRVEKRATLCKRVKYRYREPFVVTNVYIYVHL